MSQPRWIISIALLGAAVSAFFFLFSNKKNTPLSHVSAEGTHQEETPQSFNAKHDSVPRHSSSVSQTSSSSSPPSGPMPGRGARQDKAAGGKRSYDIRGAVLQEDIAFQEDSWKIWSGVTAYAKNGETPTGKIIGEVNGYYLVEENIESSSENFHPARPLVVVRESNGTAGVVTGTFVIVLEEETSPEFLLQTSSLKLVSSFPGIQTYYVTSAQVPFSLKVFQDVLKETPGVKEVKMEILNRQYEKF